jgi:hypothetical protein
MNFFIPQQKSLIECINDEDVEKSLQLIKEYEGSVTNFFVDRVNYFQKKDKDRRDSLILSCYKALNTVALKIIEIYEKVPKTRNTRFGGDLYINIYDATGKTAIYYAMKNGMEEVTEKLCKLGNTVAYEENNVRKSVFLFACEEGLANIAMKLVENVCVYYDYVAIEKKFSYNMELMNPLVIACKYSMENVIIKIFEKEPLPDTTNRFAYFISIKYGPKELETAKNLMFSNKLENAILYCLENSIITVDELIKRNLYDLDDFKNEDILDYIRVSKLDEEQKRKLNLMNPDKMFELTRTQFKKEFPETYRNWNIPGRDNTKYRKSNLEKYARNKRESRTKERPITRLKTRKTTNKRRSKTLSPSTSTRRKTLTKARTI